MTFFFLFIAMVAAVIVALFRYSAWRDREDSLAKYSQLYSFTLPYEAKARERRY